MIILQPFSQADYAQLIAWIDSPETLMQFAGPKFQFPLTVEQIMESEKEENRYSFSVFENETKTMIGHAEIMLTGHSAFFCRILIGDTAQRGKGFGQAITQALVDFSFTQLAQTKAELNVFDFNLMAIKCYEKVGFTINPNKKFEREVNGEKWTAVNMVLKKQDWKN
jgi:RimJ/RimL family protein N-acetyltransferase